METILNTKEISIEWTILKAPGGAVEQFDRSLTKLFLIGGGDIYNITSFSISSGVVSATLPTGLSVGVYDLKLIWAKNQNVTAGTKGIPPLHDHRCFHGIEDWMDNMRTINVSYIEGFVALTDVASEETRPDVESPTFKIESVVATYAYDGLSAYESAVMRGVWEGTESEYLGLPETIRQHDITATANEALRVSAEEGRVSAEAARVAAENGRVSAEALRVSAESARAEAEIARANAESARISAESARVSAETAREALAARMEDIIAHGGAGEMNVQSDWNENDTSSDAFIKNKPVIPPGSIALDMTDDDGTRTYDFTWSELNSALSGGSYVVIRCTYDDNSVKYFQRVWSDSLAISFVNYDGYTQTMIELMGGDNNNVTESSYLSYPLQRRLTFDGAPVEESDNPVTSGGVYAALQDIDVTSQISGKADKVSSATNNNFAALDSNGNLKDSGSKASDFATAAQGAKADSAYQKPSTGIPASDMASAVQTSLGKADTAVQDVSGKADKVANATTGDFAALNASGNLVDSGKKASDFQVALESGVNIKTINGNSLLGAGNITIEGGGGSDDAVLYTAQTLTDGQKAQARANIDAYSMPNGGIPASDLDDDVQTTLTNVGVNANAIDELRDSYAALTQSDIVVVVDHAAVVSPAANTIYREPGATSYADWMYYGGAWVKMAEYNNGLPVSAEDNAIGDLDISDDNGYILARFVDGQIRTKNFYSGDVYSNTQIDAALNTKQSTLVSGVNVKTIDNVSLLGEGDIDTSRTRHLKLLVIGNSYSADSFMYVPFILLRYAITIEIGIYLRGGASLQNQVDEWNDGSGSACLYYINTKTQSGWQVISTDASPKYSVEYNTWDIITIQQSSVASVDYSNYAVARDLIELIESAVDYPFTLAWNININRDSSGSDYTSIANQILANIDTACQREPVNIIFPYGTAIFNARTNNVLNAIGDGGSLYAADKVHLQEGLPCYIAAITNVQTLFNTFYPGLSVLNDSVGASITQSLINTWNVQGQNGTCTGISVENCRLGQICAILANRYNFEIKTIY